MSLFDFDDFHLLQILEIIQYSIIFFFLTIIADYVLGKYFFTETEKEIEDMSKLKLVISTLFQLIALSVMMFYIRKISMKVPSIGELLHNNYEAYRTHEYTIHIALVFFFLEITKNIKIKIELFRKLLD